MDSLNASMLAQVSACCRSTCRASTVSRHRTTARTSSGTPPNRFATTSKSISRAVWSCPLLQTLLQALFKALLHTESFDTGHIWHALFLLKLMEFICDTGQHERLASLPYTRPG